MGIKVIIRIIVVLLLNPFFCSAHKQDSIRIVQLYNTGLAATSTAYVENPFFDVDAKTLYFSVDMQRSNSADSSFLFIEIKKKTVMQYKLRPICSKKISLNEYTANPIRDSIPLEDSVFASGNFELIANFMQDSATVLDVKKARFQVLRDANQKVKDEFLAVASDMDNHIVDMSKTFVAKYDITQLHKNINALSPLARGAEIKVIRAIAENNDTSFLQHFLYNFWFNRNATNPEKAWLEYVEKLNYVAKQYGSVSQLGFESDRGRIYLVYGEPDKLDRMANEKGALPYEVWYYNNVENRGIVKFLFYQPGMLGSQMFLLTSSESDEGIDPYWKSKLLRDPNDSDNKLTHRVFEYFK